MFSQELRREKEFSAVIAKKSSAHYQTVFWQGVNAHLDANGSLLLARNNYRSWSFLRGSDRS
jgi:hypothetical protein